jgi:cephalosporin-C deacetylase
MAVIDLPLPELERYLPEPEESDDLDDFWESTLADARSHDLGLTVQRVDDPLVAIDVDDVTFAGFAGQPVKAWVTRPAGAVGPLPAVVEYIGYGGGRGFAHEHLAWAAAGYVHLLMDTRGQGGSWGNGGDTADPVGTGSSTPGFMTRGILDPADYYYRRVLTDAVRAVDAVRALPHVDASRVAVTGASQGGGLALGVSGLVPGLRAVMADVPFLCHFTRALALALADTEGYDEIVRYLAVHRDQSAQVMRTLSYVDAMHLARRADAPALFSVALRDTTCPPSTVFAAYNHYGDLTPERPQRSINVYEHNRHEGGQGYQLQRQLRWLPTVPAT